MRFIQKMYSTITAHTKEFQAFFCTRATSFLPLTTGRNVGLTATNATASICIISYSVEPRQFNANTAFFHFMSIFTR